MVEQYVGEVCVQATADAQAACERKHEAAMAAALREAEERHAAEMEGAVQTAQATLAMLPAQTGISEEPAEPMNGLRVGDRIAVQWDYDKARDSHVCSHVTCRIGGCACVPPRGIYKRCAPTRSCEYACPTAAGDGPRQVVLGHCGRDQE
eukprot:97155-Prymnesium_polylepis.2